jgi:hypothetical protein
MNYGGNIATRTPKGGRAIAFLQLAEDEILEDETPVAAKEAKKRAEPEQELVEH